MLYWPGEIICYILFGATSVCATGSRA